MPPSEYQSESGVQKPNTSHIGVIYPFMVAYLPRKGKENMKIPKARQLPSGMWFVRVRIDGEDIGITKSTEKEAVAEAMAVKAGLIENAKTPMSSKTLGAVIDEWLASNSDRLSPSTVRGYVTCRNNGFPSLMRMKCGAITSRQIEQAINAECRRYKAKTVVNRWRFVSQMLTWATGKTFSPGLPQIVRPDIDFLDRHDLDLFLSYISGRPDEILALLALSSLRRSEIAALSWDNGDIDLDNRWIHVRGSVVPDQHHKMVHKETNKNTVSRRDVPMIDPLYFALMAVEDKTGAVVKLHPATMLTRINKACADAGVPQVGCHGLRHSFASLCHMLDIPAQVAMEIGGWADRATMDRIYTHVSRREKNSYENAFTDHFKMRNERNGNKNGNGDKKTLLPQRF